MLHWRLRAVEGAFITQMNVELNVIREPDEFCQPCGLFRKCKTPVMNGEGSENPTWLFVGEAPGADEDENGYPFAGDSGSELRQAIDEVGIPLEKCRFTNVVRCRPPDNNLKAWPDAIAHCRPHILREIRATKPKVIILIGNSATGSILNKPSGILGLHGQVIDIGWTKVVCMFHPSYLLRNNTPKVRKDFYDAIRVAKRVGLGALSKKKTPQREHIVIKDRKTLQEVVDIVKKSKYPATDIESSTLSPHHLNASLGCVGISWDDNIGATFPIELRTGLTGCKVKPEECLEAVKELWEDPNLQWVVWNMTHDFPYLVGHNNIWLGGRGHKTAAFYDGMLGSWALDEKKGIHGLDSWAGRAGMADYWQQLNQHKLLYPQTDPGRGGNLLLVPADILYPYNIDDCICTRRVFFKQRKQLKEENLWEHPVMFPMMQIAWVASIMKLVGMNADLKRNEELNKLYTKRLEKLDAKLYSYPEVKEVQSQADEKLLEKLYERVTNYKRPIPNVKEKVFELFESNKEPINLNSDNIIRTLVYDILDYEVIEETKKSKEPSAARWVLEELYKKRKNPILKSILERGLYDSARDKFITPIPTWIGKDGRIHSSFNPIGTKTGRLTSFDPNLFQLPARHTLTEELMSQFIARKPGYVIVKQDSKQIELRLIAARAKDEAMIREFIEGKDPHAGGAQAAFELSEKAWNELNKDRRKELRDYAKNAVSFGLVYGRMAAALAADFGWPVRKAEEFKERYFGKYHGIKDYLENEAERIREEKESISSYGRHRRVPEVDNEEERLQAEAIREAINAPIQGDASDINIIAAYRMSRWLMANGYKTRVFLYVYDAVWLDAKIKELEEVIPKLKEFMTDRDYIRKVIGWKLTVPLDTDCAIGYRAGSMKELERDSKGNFIIPKEI